MSTPGHGAPEGCLDLPVGEAVKVEVCAVVDVEEHVADGVDVAEGGGAVGEVPSVLPLQLDVEAGHHVQHRLGRGQQGEADQGGHQQDAAQRGVNIIMTRLQCYIY